MNNFEKIEAYTAGWMSAPERSAFEESLRQDPVLRQDYEDWLATEATLGRQLSNQEGAQKLRDLLQPLTAQYFAAEKARRGRVIGMKKYLIAAVAAALLLLLLLRTPGGIEDYKIPEMPAASVRGSQQVQQGAQLFNTQQYEAALPYLQKQVAAAPSDATAAFYLALCYIKTNSFEKAWPLCTKLANTVSVYKEDAAFFAALAAYKLGNPADASIYAQKVPPQNRYYKNARRLLKELH